NQGLLGESHPATLEALYAYAHYVRDPRLAFALMSTAADAYRTVHPSLRQPIARTLTRQAFLAVELGDFARAASIYELALASSAGSDDDALVTWRHLCAGELALLRKDAQGAVDELSAARDIRGRSKSWWERAEALRASVGLAQAEVARGHDDAATHLLEQ